MWNSDCRNRGILPEIDWGRKAKGGPVMIRSVVIATLSAFSINITPAFAQEGICIDEILDDFDKPKCTAPGNPGTTITNPLPFPRPAPKPR
jgi:hypothetical protein